MVIIIRKRCILWIFLTLIICKSVLHLQCHFGQDSISLAKLGAKVTAVDFSDKAIEKGKEIAAQMNADVNFICCDIYNLKSYLNEEFDIVFTSYGTIGWLPDLDKWASIIKSFLKGYLICESSLFRTRKAGLGSAFLYA